MTLAKEKKYTSIDRFFPPLQSMQRKKRESKGKSQKNKELLCLEQKLCLLYAYVYENNFPKNFYLN